MQRISILERDLTTSGFDPSEFTDVVYIPGFAICNINPNVVYTGDTSTGGAPVHYPVLCKDLDTFHGYFGVNVPYFSTVQYYPTGANGFSAAAIPGTGSSVVMFNAGDPDPSYMLAKELISQGIPVIYERINYYKPDDVIPEGEHLDITVVDMYAGMVESFAESSVLFDKGQYQFKYLTSGGYPTFEFAGNALAKGMCELCAVRGDAVALIDHTDHPNRELNPTNQNSLYYALNGSEASPSPVFTTSNSSYGTMFSPWAIYSCVKAYEIPASANVIGYIDPAGNPATFPGSIRTSATFPGSYAYLCSLAKSIKTNPNWLAIAGATRGVVPNLQAIHLAHVLTNKIAEAYQPDLTATVGEAINPITNIKPYGQAIWGNRTLKSNADQKGCVATSFLNIRNVVSDVKKQLYIAAKSLMFEQNNDVLWVNFKSMITPLLDQMVTGAALSGYKLIKNTTKDNNGRKLPKSKLSCIVRLYPLYAVEAFDIVVELSDEEVTVE